MKTSKRDWRHSIVWMFWFLTVLMLAWAHALPVSEIDRGVMIQSAPPMSMLGCEAGVEIALPVVAGVATHDRGQGLFFPWHSRRRWRKWKLIRYLAALRACRRAKWTARLAYCQAVWAAGVARLLLSGVIAMATIVDLLTKSQMRQQLGCLPVLYAVLDVLRVREIINRYCPTPKAEVDYGTVSIVLILNRLTAPRALYRVADWVAQTVLVQTLGVPAEKFNDDRLGRTLDAIAKYRREIWQDIVNEALTQFDIDLSFIFYDLTAFVMQGEYEESELVDYGFAHNTPSDKKKFKIGASAASDGDVMVDYETLNGRTADIATVQENMERLSRVLRRQGYVLDQVVIIGDRGTLNDEIAIKYDEKGLKYLAGLKVHKKAHIELLKTIPAKQIGEHPLTDEQGAKGFYGLPCQITFTHDDQTVTHRGLVVIAGPMRTATRKTRAQQLRALRTELMQVHAKIGQPRYRSVKCVQARAETQLRNSPVGKLMRVEAYQTDDGRIDLRWWIDTDALWHMMEMDGRYLLVTNDFTLSLRQMIQLYRAKDGVEKCFRISKHELKVRPIYVHSDKRIEALLLVNMLALLVYRLLEREMHTKGLQLTTRRLIEQLEDLTVIETQCWDGSVLCRLTPTNQEQRRLISFLAAILTELRIRRVHPALPAGFPSLPDSPVAALPPPGQPLLTVVV